MLRATPLALAALLAAPAHADIIAGDGGPIIAWYVGEGADVRKSIDDYGDPLLDITHFGRAFQIYFYGCDDGRNCGSIQFFSGYQTTGGVRQADINDWNAGRRYLRAYLSDEGSARIEYDIHLGNGGLSQDDFAEVTAIWLRGMDDFEEHIDL
jgi:hypothetical protein